MKREIILHNSTMPSEPYSSEGLKYRAYNYRHQVTHRGLNPFIYKDPLNPSVKVCLKIDPRNNLEIPSELLRPQP